MHVRRIIASFAYGSLLVTLMNLDKGIAAITADKMLMCVGARLHAHSKAISGAHNSFSVWKTASRND